MKQQAEFEDCEVEDAPVTPLFTEERKNRYGSVPGLDDEELADPCELERQVMLAEWGPVMRLPVRTNKGWIQPDIDEDFGLDFGAFATVDFARTMPEFDKARYKADKLQEKLRDVLIMLSIVTERVPRAKYKVLKYLRMGVIDLEHIENADMLALAKLYQQAKNLRQQIQELRDASWAMRQRQAAWVLE